MTVTSDYVGEIFRGLKYGDGAAFFRHVADDVDWSVMGAHPFAGDYRNRAALVAGTFVKLAQVLPQGARLHVENLTVRDSQASIGLHALVAAKNGMWFDNHYCWIVCFRGDKIAGARGYPDSVMIARSLNRRGDAFQRAAPARYRRQAQTPGADDERYGAQNRTRFSGHDAHVRSHDRVFTRYAP